MKKVLGPIPTKIAFRVDASFQMGTGHVMRCLTLAEALRDRGATVVFVCREHPGNLCQMIFDKDFEVLRLGFDQDPEKKMIRSDHGKIQNRLAHAAWLGVNQSTDARQTIAALQKYTPWDWIIVDHYALENLWETAMRKLAEKIMVIDDLADRLHDCDLLLDQNYFHGSDSRYKGLLPETCVTLLGPGYALLRPHFREARKFTRMRGNVISRLLVYFGGNDPDNLTGKALQAIDIPELNHLWVDVVIGFNNPFLEELKRIVKNRFGTRLHIQPEGFIELLLRADLCVGAGGSTTWERLCLNLPTIVITVAKNQEVHTAALAMKGYVNWIGRKEDISVLDIRQHVMDKISSQARAHTVSNLPNLVDGFGVLRVLEMLIPSSQQKLTLRRAAKDDMEQYFFWANDPVTRQNSFHPEFISWEEHMTWFVHKCGSSQNRMWVMLSSKGLPVGQIRFDVQDGKADIAYSLDPVVRGRGWAKKLIEMGISAFLKFHPGIIPQARVKTDNIFSKRSFQRLGFLEKIEGDVSVFFWQ